MKQVLFAIAVLFATATGAFAQYEKQVIVEDFQYWTYGANSSDPANSIEYTVFNDGKYETEVYWGDYTPEDSATAAERMNMEFGAMGMTIQASVSADGTLTLSFRDQLLVQNYNMAMMPVEDANGLTNGGQPFTESYTCSAGLCQASSSTEAPNSILEALFAQILAQVDFTKILIALGTIFGGIIYVTLLIEASLYLYAAITDREYKSATRAAGATAIGAAQWVNIKNTENREKAQRAEQEKRYQRYAERRQFRDRYQREKRR